MYEPTVIRMKNVSYHDEKLELNQNKNKNICNTRYIIVCYDKE
jgi:hypothetical protein